jgi:NAD-dependent SIR2 family protein deacetylase
MEDAVAALKAAKRVVVFTGAGMSADSGIATFRTKGYYFNDSCVLSLVWAHFFFFNILNTGVICAKGMAFGMVYGAL